MSKILTVMTFGRRFQLYTKPENCQIQLKVQNNEIYLKSNKIS